jgi:hypothetical protein
MAIERVRPLLAILILLLSVFATEPADARKASAKHLEKVLFDYSSSIRWSEFDTAWTFVDPAYRSENPITELDLERYAQFSVAGYLVRRRETISKTEYAQLVEIRLVNKHTQVEKVLNDKEHWRWDPETKRWWLTTGLPKLSRD